MHGTIRFFLATLVLLSHLGITFYGYNLGVSAVVLFYLLAGMVSYKLLSTMYENRPVAYYLDRIKRIFPLYFLVLAFSYGVYLLGASSYFISSSPDFVSFLSNLTIIPLSYYMYSGIDKFTLLPPAWSLGVELQFYILAPFIILHFKKTIVILFLSLGVYLLAITGILQTDYFGYRLIVGVLFIFLVGAQIQKSLMIGVRLQSNPLVFVYILLWITAIYLYNIGYKAPYNYETLAALLIGIPFFALHKKIQKFATIDKYLGSLSYAVFLVHFPVFWLFELYGYNSKELFLILPMTLFLSIFFVFLENRINLFLHNNKNKKFIPHHHQK